jgi:condensin complex subunit 3
VLENAVSSLSSHDLFDNMVKIILSAVTSSNRPIREVGISCFGKLGLFSDESTVLNEFKPILLKIVANDREALQCRGQALLALADWTLLYKDVLTPYQDNDGQSLTLLEFVHDMTQHANKSIASIAAEVAAKLLFSGRVSDHDLVGRLLACFLDPNRQKDTEEEDTDDASTEVGSPLRLQQLLSLFFPALCLKSDESRRLLLDSIGSAMKIAVSLPKTKKRPLVFPLVKLAEYVCSIITQSHIAAKENADSGEELDTDEVFFAGSLQVARFLVKHEGDLSVTQRRSLFKFLGGQNFEISSIDKISLSKFKGYVNDLSFISDSSSVKSLGPLIELLRDVEGGLDDDDDEGSEDGPAAATVDASSDDETVTEHSSENEGDGDAETAGESTVDDVLMDTLAALTMKSKENPARRSSGKIFHRNRRSSSQSNISVLESLGSPNHV